MHKVNIVTEENDRHAESESDGERVSKKMYYKHKRNRITNRIIHEMSFAILCLKCVHVSASPFDCIKLSTPKYYAVLPRARSFECVHMYTVHRTSYNSLWVCFGRISCLLFICHTKCSFFVFSLLFSLLFLFAFLFAFILNQGDHFYSVKLCNNNSSLTLYTAVLMDFFLSFFFLQKINKSRMECHRLE